MKLAAAVVAALTYASLGSHWAADSAGKWTLTSVGPAPAAAGAWLELLPDGEFLANDGVNFTSARFTRTRDGFVVHDGGTTLAGYPGHDPGRLTAIAGIWALANPGRDTIVSESAIRLVVEAGGYRLTFDRAG